MDNPVIVIQSQGRRRVRPNLAVHNTSPITVPAKAIGPLLAGLLLAGQEEAVDGPGEVLHVDRRGFPIQELTFPQRLAAIEFLDGSQ